MIIWVGIVSFFNEYAHRRMFSGQILVLKIRVVRSGSVDIRQERWLARQAVFPFSFTNTTLSADVPMSAQRYIFSSARFDVFSAIHTIGHHVLLTFTTCLD